jgi:hypothetical protein
MSSSRDFLGQALGVTPDKNNNVAYGDRDSALQRRQLAARDAAMNGYSLALAQRQQIQPALERAASLADQATSAATLMDQQRTTNYLLSAIAGEMVAQRSLMASYLEVVSTSTLQSQPVIEALFRIRQGHRDSPAGKAIIAWCRRHASVWVIEDGDRRLEAPPVPLDGAAAATHIEIDG